MGGARAESEWTAVKLCVQHMTSNGVTLRERLAEQAMSAGMYWTSLARLFERAERALRRLGDG